MMDIEDIAGKCLNAEVRDVKGIGKVILCKSIGYGCSPPFQAYDLKNKKVCIVMTFYKPSELTIRVLDISEKKMINCPYPNKK